MHRWAFMVYMGGNNNLASATDGDIEEIRSVGGSEDLGIAVFVRRELRPGVSGPARRFRVGAGGAEEDAEELGDVDSGDPKTVLDFAAWGMGMMPAERYALVLWNHGSGFRPDDFDALYTEAERSSARVRPAELVERARQPVARLFFTPSVRTIVTRPTEGERAILSDDATGHSLDTIELRKVIEGVNRRLGRKLDVLGMDACLMSTFEVAYEVRDLVEIVVGSEELEPNAGWDYAGVLRDLASDGLDAEALGRSIVRRYVDSYSGSPSDWPITQSATRGAAADGFAGKLDALADALIEAAPGEWNKIDAAFGRSAHLAETHGMELVDLASFCGQLLDSTLGELVKSTAGEVIDAHAPGEFIVAEGHLGDQVATCGGISVHLPAARRPLSPYYGDLRLSMDHRWDDLLHRLAEARLETR
jgi:Clostripain family